MSYAETIKRPVLRDYSEQNWAQKAAQRGIVNALQQGHKKIYVEMPQGTGKTDVYTFILQMLHESDALPQTLIMSATRPLLEQIKEEIKICAPDVAPLISRYLKSHDGLSSRVALAAYPSGLDGLRTGKIPKEGLLLIGDEGHLLLSKRRKADMQEMEGAIQILFTATPGYYKGKSLSDAGYHEAFRLDRQTATETNLMVPVRAIPVEVTDHKYSLDQVAARGGDYDADDLDKILHDDILNGEIANFFEAWRQPGTGASLLEKTGIIFAGSINDCKDIAQLFNGRFADRMEKGVTPCAAIWGAMPEFQRNELIRKHKSGEIKYLVSVDYLILGYNNPRLEVTFNKRPTCSSVVAGQRPRGSRIDPANPDKVELVFDMVYPGSERPQLLYNQVLGRVMYGVEDIPRLRPIVDDHYQPGMLRAHYLADDVNSFMAKRRQEAGRAYHGQMRRLLPSVRKAMIKSGLSSVGELSQQVWAWKRAVQEVKGEDTASRGKFGQPEIFRIAKGLDSPFDKDGKDYNSAAYAIACALKTPMSELFGEPILEREMRLVEGEPDEAPYTYRSKTVVSDTVLPVHVRKRKGELANIEDTAIDLNSLQDAFDHAPDRWVGAPSSPDRCMEQTELQDCIRAALAGAHPRHEKVANLRFGLNGEPSLTLKEIAKIFNVTSGERIRQMEMKVMQRLRHRRHVTKLEAHI